MNHKQKLKICICKTNFDRASVRDRRQEMGEWGRAIQVETVDFLPNKHPAIVAEITKLPCSIED